MKLGWLWLSILNTTASPSPISITPAFSPGPWITHGACVGSVRRWIFDDLYEQCSFHMAEKMPSSVIEGSRPMRSSTRWYSSGLSPCAAISWGVVSGFPPPLGFPLGVVPAGPLTGSASPDLAAGAPGRVLRPRAGGLDVMDPRMSWPSNVMAGRRTTSRLPRFAAHDPRDSGKPGFRAMLNDDRSTDHVD